MLNRRRFIALLSASLALLPGAAQAFALPSMFRLPGPVLRSPQGEAGWEILETAAPGALNALNGRELQLTGYVTRQGGAVFLTRLPYHCDYCYLGNSKARVRVDGISAPLSSQRMTVRGFFQTGRDGSDHVLGPAV